jgi:trk system potassium uptake protein TrkA
VQIVIVGAGQVGFDLAVHLQRSKHDVALVEADRQRCEAIGEKLDILVVQGSGSSPHTLEAAGIQQAQMVVAVTSVDEVNIMVCGLAQQYGVERRIARVRRRELTRRRAAVSLKSLGVSHVIDSEGIIVGIIDQIARIPDAVEVFAYHDGEVIIVRHVMTAQMPIIGHTLAEALQKAEPHRLLAVALRRRGEVRIPTGDDVFKPGDDYTSVMPKGSLPKYLSFLGLERRSVKKAIVGGSGPTAVLLCERFKEWIEDVTLVDPDREHGQQAAEQLDGVEVIHGDPTERDILGEVNVSGADLYVGAGKRTTPNVMSALLARSEGTAKVVALSNEPHNNRLFRKIGVHHVVSPRRAMAWEIMDLIHRGRISMELQLRDLDIESLAIRAEQHSKITRGALHKVWEPLKGKAIVGAVIHDGAPEIPSGATQVEEGDEVIVVTHPGSVRNSEDLVRKR